MFTSVFKSIPSIAFATILIFKAFFRKIRFFSPNFWISGTFWDFLEITKMRAPKFHAEWSGFHAEISHMRPIQGQKLKLEIDHFPDPLKN